MSRIEDSFAQTPSAGIMLGEAHLEEHPGHNQKSHGRKFSAMADDTMRWDGTSVNYVGHKPKTGIMVGGVVPSKVLPAGASRNDIRDGAKAFMDQHRETLKKPGHYLGIWRDTEGDGRTWIDISQRFPTVKAASTAGVERNEIEGYNVRTGKPVKFGGTGNEEGQTDG